MTYVALDADLHPYEISASASAFRTHWYRVTEPEEAAMALALVGQVIRRDLGHGGGLEAFDEADFDRFQIQVVEEPETPEGKVVETRTILVGEDRVATIACTFADPPPPPVPAEISRMQAELTLEAQGLLDQVEAAVASASRRVQVYWRTFSTMHRDHEILAEMTEGLGWSADQVDDLFRAASLER